MPAPEESVMCRQWRWVGCLQYQMLTALIDTPDKSSFFLCVAAPQQENDRLGLVSDKVHDSIGELFPPLATMRGCFPIAYGQNTIEKKDTLPCPGFQISVPWSRDMEVTFQFLVDVHE